MNETFAEWEARPLHEKLRALPDRHPPAIKVLLWIMMGLDKFDVDLLHRIAAKMGWFPIEQVERGKLVGETREGEEVEINVSVQMWPNGSWYSVSGDLL